MPAAMRRTLLALTIVVLAVLAVDFAALAAFPGAWTRITENQPGTASQAPRPVATAEPAATTSSNPALPIGSEPAGMRDARRALAEAGASSVSGGQWPTWCQAQPQAPWMLSGTSATGTHVSIALTSSGQGQQQWDRMLSHLSDCTEFNILDQSEDEIVLGRTDVPVTWMLARDRDAIVSAYRVAPSSLADVQDAARAALTTTTADCRGQGEGPQRNPSFPGYAQYQAQEEIPVPVPVFKSGTRAAIEPTWVAPEPSEQPQLAPLAPADEYSNPATSSIDSAPTLAAPMLTDPALISPPTSLKPDTASAEAPTLPTKPVSPAPVLVDTVDADGPGCGWAWASSTSPAQDAAAISASARGQREQATSAAVSAGGRWFLAQAAKRAYRSEEQALEQARVDWNAYEEYLIQAQELWDAAVQERSASEQAWLDWQAPAVLPSEQPVPVPAPVPLPSASAAPPQSPGVIP